VTAEMLGSIAVGSAVGLTAGIAVERLVESLLFEVRSTDPSSWSLPILTMAATATLAALPPVARAIRIDPAQTLRSE
jgi:putative ABC transport system permease protein